MGWWTNEWMVHDSSSTAWVPMHPRSLMEPSARVDTKKPPPLRKCSPTTRLNPRRKTCKIWVKTELQGVRLIQAVPGSAKASACHA